MKFLVTGAAGFIGYHISIRLLSSGYQVIGLDNLNGHYSVSLKKSRLERLSTWTKFTFYKIDLSDHKSISDLFIREQFERVIHLGAQTGVRYSLKNPLVYADTNVIGHLNILEGCRYNNVQHLLYASSSSVYGLNQEIPFSIKDSVDRPISLYAATKKSNELMAYTYSHLYNLPTTGLRFFTVYGPWGRPDMALFKFTKSIINGKKIDIYNYGNMKRDFTYINDIIEVIFRLQNLIPTENTNCTEKISYLSDTLTPYRIYNIGNGNPITLKYCIKELEKFIGIQAKKNFLPIQPGDMLITHANIDTLYNAIGFKPQTPITKGIQYFVKWYREYYQC